MRASGTHIALRIWPDQRDFLERNGIELAPLVRELIDAMRGAESEIDRSRKQEATLRRSIISHAVAAQLQLVQAARNRDEIHAKARSAAMGALRRAFKLQERSTKGYGANLAWVEGRILEIPILRTVRPPEILDELLEIPLEGKSA